MVIGKDGRHEDIPVGRASMAAELTVAMTPAAATATFLICILTVRRSACEMEVLSERNKLMVWKLSGGRKRMEAVRAG